MEKTPNKYALAIRIVCYVLIPIFIVSILQSAISLFYFAEQGGKVETNHYFETEQFADLYKQSIYNNIRENYSYTEEDGYELDVENVYGITEQNTINERIYYTTYLEDKNFKFLIIDNKTNQAITNVEQTMKTDTIEKIQQELSGYSYYWNYENGTIHTNIEKLSLENIKYKYPYKSIEEAYNCKIYTGIKEPIQYYDNYYTTSVLYKIAAESNDTALINIPLSIIAIFVCMLLITIFTGRKRGQKEVYLNFIDKIPLEIVSIFILSMVTMALALLVELSYRINVITLIAILVTSGMMYITGMITYETLVKRIKAHTFWKNTIVYRLYKVITKWVKNILGHFNLSIKILLILITFIVATSILIHCEFIGFVLLIIMCVLIFKYSFSHAKQFLEIKDTIKELYEGNTQIRLQEEEYEGVLKELCIYVNDIAGGFTNAIEKSLKSERMKTELITNVSHDIKTPLTSIINYVDLLKKEEIPNEKVKEYLEILDQKSQRLKHLTEDLVEASKASSGNIKLNMERLDVKELMKQVSGEFEDKLKEKNLELILSMPEEEAMVIADSRYLYRVVENMYSNIAKYALPNSRVYVDILVKEEKVEIELKNISKEKLNISADELMERFVRGESSRNTEGSGLGLSIAQSLTQLQKGEFNIYLDGDLFKVTITFEKKF